MLPMHALFDNSDGTRYTIGGFTCEFYFFAKSQQQIFLFFMYTFGVCGGILSLSHGSTVDCLLYFLKFLQLTICDVMSGTKCVILDQLFLHCCDSIFYENCT